MSGSKNSQITLDIPSSESKGGYIETIMSHFGRQSFIVASSQDLDTPTKMWMNATIIIGMMPEEEQDRLFRYRKEVLKEIILERETELKRHLNDIEKDNQRMEASARVIGKCFGLLDDNIGISKEHRIAIDLSPDGEKDELIKKLQDEIASLKGIPNKKIELTSQG